MRMSLKSVVARHSLLLFVTWLAACPYSAFGIQASSQSFQVQQPDDTVVTLQLRGDDRVRFDKDNDGYQVTKQKQQQSGKDIFVYATFNTSSQTVAATNKEVGKVNPNTDSGLKKGFLDPAAAAAARNSPESDVPALVACLSTQTREGVRYSGSLVRKPASASTLVECQQRCVIEPACRFWSYSSAAEMCFLYSAIEEAREQRVFVSGCIANSTLARVRDTTVDTFDAAQCIAENIQNGKFYIDARYWLFTPPAGGWTRNPSGGYIQDDIITTVTDVKAEQVLNPSNIKRACGLFRSGFLQVSFQLSMKKVKAEGINLRVQLNGVEYMAIAHSDVGGSKWAIAGLNGGTVNQTSITSTSIQEYDATVWVPCTDKSFTLISFVVSASGGSAQAKIGDVSIPGCT